MSVEQRWCIRSRPTAGGGRVVAVAGGVADCHHAVGDGV